MHLHDIFEQVTCVYYVNVINLYTMISVVIVEKPAYHKAFQKECIIICTNNKLKKFVTVSAHRGTEPYQNYRQNVLMLKF